MGNFYIHNTIKTIYGGIPMAPSKRNANCPIRIYAIRGTIFSHVIHVYSVRGVESLGVSRKNI